MTEKICPDCNGFGVVVTGDDYHEETCDYCNGTGRVSLNTPD